MITDEMEIAVREALARLCDAVSQLHAKPYLAVPLPRPRVFVFVQTDTGPVRWPSRRGSEADFGVVDACGREYYLYRVPKGTSELPEVIVKLCGERPRAVLRAIRRIEAAAEWCLRRAEGRRRMAVEILRQQERFAKEIEARAVLAGLEGKP